MGDGDPPDAVTVAPVLWCAVHALAAVAPQEVAEVLVGPQPPPLFGAVDVGEVIAQCGEALPVALLQPGDRPVELPLGQPLRTFDPHTPGQFVQRGQRDEPGEPGDAALAPRRRAAGPDPGRFEGERAQEGVDVVGDARLLGARSALVGGEHPRAGGPQGGVLLLAQPDGHRANVASVVPNC